MKTCGCCGADKSFEEFYRRSAAKDGYQAYCKDCHIARHSEWYKDNKAYHAAYSREAKYGHCINYDALVERYDSVNACECCGIVFGDASSNKKCVDHSGDMIRGIICSSCNIGIGHLKDTYEGVLAALEYLDRVEVKGGQ